MKEIANSSLSVVVIEEMEKIITEVADIRVSIGVKPEIENEVRKAVCEILEERVIKPIKRLKGEIVDVKEDYD